ncbi:syntaxin-17 isoform X1 [Hydra vulgaris]|uniref:Syntaxin-17 n=1 Tax=Hydra vulgaris TaxID=6087 RepID=T2MEJ3_HYDVU|nr:syntaxin-17 [Hydra vulgaris]
MWLKYQQVNAKMASFAPKEIIATKEDTPKYQLKRFEPTLRKALSVVVPLNLNRLKKHKQNIEKLVHDKNWQELNKEQINATLTVQQLQATIRDMENIKDQIVYADLEEFQKRVAPMQNETANAIKEFANVQNLLINEVEKSIMQNKGSDIQVDKYKSSLLHEIPLVENDLSNELLADHAKDLYLQGSQQMQIISNDQQIQEINACQSWDELRESLVDLHSLVQDFATMVHSQQDSVDRIEDNIERASVNVHSAATFLAQASKYKAVAIPVAGAVIGGIIGGPIGLLAGFKLAGVATAVGGGLAGYQGGKYLKKKHDQRVELELDNLSKRKSDSMKSLNSSKHEN